MNAESRMEPAAPMTFIVRVSQDAGGGVRGIVERARTGEKQQFHGVEAISPLIARMVENDDRIQEEEDNHGRLR